MNRSEKNLLNNIVDIAIPGYNNTCTMHEKKFEKVNIGRGTRDELYNYYINLKCAPFKKK